MNIYFLVEGKRTEVKVYPKWLSHLVPELSRVNAFDQVHENNYYIFSGNGFPSLLDNHLRNCVEDVNHLGCYNYLVICLDGDDDGIASCKQGILDFMEKEAIRLVPQTKFEIIVQNKCLETWFLANPRIFKKNPGDNLLREYMDFYNVKNRDPELMGKPLGFFGSTSVFHASYLQRLLAERNVVYTKKNPQSVIEAYFLQELVMRNQKTNHIQSFGYFTDFCEQVRANIVKT
ncbi:MAG: hypothetical protein MUC97_13860 [Bernardetiaceae bacterium]|jgi:hypothetical protein|nr:hypothetical protein [Bernardetiaceae bacterium]